MIAIWVQGHFATRRMCIQFSLWEATVFFISWCQEQYRLERKMSWKMDFSELEGFQKRCFLRKKGVGSYMKYYQELPQLHLEGVKGLHWAYVQLELSLMKPETFFIPQIIYGWSLLWWLECYWLESGENTVCSEWIIAMGKLIRGARDIIGKILAGDLKARHEFLVRMMTVNTSRAPHLVICYLQAKRAIQKMVKTPPHVHVTHACMATFGMQSQRPRVSILLILRACLQKLIFQKNILFWNHFNSATFLSSLQS